MTSKASSLVAARNGNQLGNVSTWQASDIPSITPNVAELQSSFVRRRVRATPALAPVIANLAFGEVRA